MSRIELAQEFTCSRWAPGGVRFSVRGLPGATSGAGEIAHRSLEARQSGDLAIEDKSAVLSTCRKGATEIAIQVKPLLKRDANAVLLVLYSPADCGLAEIGAVARQRLHCSSTAKTCQRYRRSGDRSGMLGVSACRERRRGASLPAFKTLTAQRRGLL